jgi:hypothetical protein
MYQDLKQLRLEKSQNLLGILFQRLPAITFIKNEKMEFSLL